MEPIRMFVKTDIFFFNIFTTQYRQETKLEHQETFDKRATASCSLQRTQRSSYPRVALRASYLINNSKHCVSYWNLNTKYLTMLTQYCLHRVSMQWEWCLIKVGNSGLARAVATSTNQTSQRLSKESSCSLLTLLFIALLSATYTL